MEENRKATAIARGAIARCVAGGLQTAYFSPTMPISYLAVILADITSPDRSTRESAKNKVRELVKLGENHEQ